MEKIVKLPLTCDHKTFVVKWFSGHPAMHQLSTTVDKNTARKPNYLVF